MGVFSALRNISRPLRLGIVFTYLPRIDNFDTSSDGKERIKWYLYIIKKSDKFWSLDASTDVDWLVLPTR